MSNEALYGLVLLAALVLFVAGGIVLVNWFLSKAKGNHDGKH